LILFDFSSKERGGIFYSGESMDWRHGIGRDPARIQNTATFSPDQSFPFVNFVNLSEAGVKKFFCARPVNGKIKSLILFVPGLAGIQETSDKTDKKIRHSSVDGQSGGGRITKSHIGNGVIPVIAWMRVAEGERT